MLNGQCYPYNIELFSFGTAPNDYTSVSAQLVFVIGQNATHNSLACGTIDIVDDNVVEVNEESLTVSISANDPSVTLITVPSAVIIINEDDNDGIPQFNMISYNIIAI